MKLNRDSNLFKELTDNELKSIVLSNFHRNTKIVESTLMKGGLFNTTYYISIDNPRKKIICRLAPEESELLYTFEKHMMSYESHLYNELTNSDIPVPTFIKYDSSKKDVCREYTLTEYLDSIPMSVAENINEKEKDELYRDIGKITKQIHDIKSDFYGFPCLNKFVKYTSWYDFLLSFMNEILERADHYGLLNHELLYKIENAFLINRGIFALPEKGSLLHCDLWEGNILVNNDNGKWQVAAIIDIDRAIFGDIHFEFSTPWIICPQFMKGYGRKIEEDETAQLKRKMYYLLIQLMNSDVWLIQYNNKDLHEKIQNEAIKTLDAL